jgi:hypothetical protein
MPVDLSRNPRSQREQTQDPASRIGEIDFTESFVCPEKPNRDITSLPGRYGFPASTETGGQPYSVPS